MQVYQYISQLKLCARRQKPGALKQLHAHFIKSAIDRCEPFPNTLIDAYGKCGLLQDACQVFEEIPHRDLISWVSIFTAHNQANLPRRTLSLFLKMSMLDRLRPDHFVLASLVKACACSGDIRLGKQVHAWFVSSSFCTDNVVKSSLVDMYAKCGLCDEAYSVFASIDSKNPASWTAMISGFARSGRKSDALGLFETTPFRNLFSWTALISGLVQSGNGLDAFHCFDEMRREGVDLAEPLVFSSIVGACANLAALQLGRQVHVLVIALGFESCVYISNALIDMYAKCSDIVAANEIFGRIREKDVVSWTSIIVGVAQHGKGNDALALYDKMTDVGIRPNEVTFVGLLHACSHAGLVDKGRDLFKSMIECYRIRPSLTHYTCFVDLLSRSGYLDEAESVINSVPFELDEAIWAALLTACKHRGNVQMGIRIADRMLRSKIVDPSTYILLSNIYASAGMWENVSNTRKLMEGMEVKKTPGYSAVECGKETLVFYAGETSHPMRDEIFNLLKELEAEMRRRGYVPDTSSVLHDMEHQEKERQLFWHSERMAVAYGLLKAVSGTTIRIVKNLRICGDCHTVLNLISTITNREIFVRDANRYHHFKEGRCSCNNFW